MSKSPAHTTAPIVAARLIVRGDVSGARAVLSTHPWGNTYRVCEIRALIGACEAANRRYGCSLDWREIARLFA